jgi:hypothetical protein
LCRITWRAASIKRGRLDYVGMADEKTMLGEYAGWRIN